MGSTGGTLRIRNALPPMDGAPATAGQPTEDQLRMLAASGTQAIINLGLLDPDYCLADEAGLVEGLGMLYHHLPVAFNAPELMDLRRFFAIMERLSDVDVFVHCAANYRATCFVALFGEARLGWSRVQADAYINRVWEPDAIWKAFLARARGEIEEETGRAPDLTSGDQPGSSSPGWRWTNASQ